MIVDTILIWNNALRKALYINNLKTPLQVYNSYKCIYIELSTHNQNVYVHNALD